MRKTSDELFQLAARALAGAGAHEGMARAAARHLVSAEEQGLPTHGMSRVAFYAAMLQNGRADGAARPSIVNQRPGACLIDNRDGGRWLNAAGLAEAARFATGIGPAKALLDGHADIVKAAHSAGLTVTPYTFTSRAPAVKFGSLANEMRYYLSDLNVDALFTDNPDQFPR